MEVDQIAEIMSRIGRKRKSVRPSTKKKVFNAAGWLCHWCGCRIQKYDESVGWKPDSATIDHVIPRWKGGTNDLENLVASCKKCNEFRNDFDRNQAKHKAPKFPVVYVPAEEFLSFR